MAKSTKSVKVTQVGPTLAADTAMIARDFSTFGKFTANNDARTALLRRVTDADTFKAIKVSASAAWVQHDQGCTAARALLIVDGTLANPNQTIGKKEKRTAPEQSAYKRVNSAWSYYLACNGIAQLTRAPATRKPKMAGEKAKPETTSAAPQTIQSFVSAKVANIGEVIGLFNLGKAYFNKTANANSKILVGDAGTALRALCAHVSNELARIEAMKG